MKYTIHIDDKPIIFEHADFDDIINVDDLTKIDASNIFGEATTISAAANRIGLLKAEVEATMAEAKLEYKLYEGNFKANLRKQASDNGGFYTMRVKNSDVKVKATETALATSYESDEKWIEIKKKFIKAERNFNALSSLYWATQDKARKLNGLVNGTTPEEFYRELTEGKFNGILVEKKKK